jgi:signal peptidase I
MSKQITMKDIPSVVELQQERVRERYKIRYNRAIRSTISTLVTVAAIAVIISYVMMPVLRIYGHSMTPTLTDGQIVLAMKNANFEIGDIIAFYYSN